MPASARAAGLTVSGQVELEDGSKPQLSELHQGGQIVLVFLRHFGCVFCRYQVAQLRPATDLPIYFVCMESVDEASKFKADNRSPHHFISDPERKLYEAYGVKQGSLGQLFNLRTLGKGIKATLSGSLQGKPTSDPKQLGATVILKQSGEIGWSKYAEDASEIVSEATIREQLGRL